MQLLIHITDTVNATGQLEGQLFGNSCMGNKWYEEFAASTRLNVQATPLELMDLKHVFLRLFQLNNKWWDTTHIRHKYDY